MIVCDLGIAHEKVLLQCCDSNSRNLEAVVGTHVIAFCLHLQRRLAAVVRLLVTLPTWSPKSSPQDSLSEAVGRKDRLRCDHVYSVFDELLRILAVPKARSQKREAKPYKTK